MCIDVVLNASLLLALVVVFDLVVPTRTKSAAQSRTRVLGLDLATGAMLGLAVVAVMMTPWTYTDGVVIDTRSVLLTASGLFFGVVPTVVAVVAAALYRLHLGGAGAPVGVFVIFLASGAGLLMRRWWCDRLAALRWFEFAVLGVVVHMAIIASFAASSVPGPVDFARDVAPVMLTIHPVAFVVISLLLAHRVGRHSTMRELAESEARYHQVFDNEFVSAMIIDPEDGRILDVSRCATAFYGWTRDEMLTMTTSDLEVLPRDEVLRQIDEGRAERRPAFEFEHRLANGEIREVEVIGGPVMIDGQMRVHAVINDITERKATERALAAANERLHHADKMDAIGRLAGGIAHDFNNMLQVIEGYASLAALEVVPGSELAEHLDEIRSAAERSSELTHQLLAFAKRQPIVPRIVDPCQVVGDSVRWLQRLVGEEISIVAGPSSTWQVRADPGQLTQILANLVVNARDAMHGHGNIDIATADVRVESTDPTGPTEYVRITVADDGPGMSAEMAATAFEPFVTARGEVGRAGGDDTGLGLSIVDTIVTQHGGFVELDTSPDHGARFHLYFPRAADDDAAADTGPQTAPPARATVLLVEDDPAVLRLGERMLRQQGHRVLTAANGDEALAIVRAEGDGIDLVVTDVVMPGAAVADVVAALHATHPETPVLFVSGYTDDLLSGRGVEGDELELLPKPFSADELVSRVAQLIATHPVRR